MALSIRAPWWWFILHAEKDVENRDWWTSYTGPLLIHASKYLSRGAVADDLDATIGLAGPAFGRLPDCNLGALRAAGGHIVGRVTMTKCVSRSSSPWFFGRNGFLLEDPVAFERPIPFSGQLRLFDVPDDLIETTQGGAG